MKKVSKATREYFERRKQAEKDALDKGWMPKNPAKFNVSKKLIGKHIRMGWIDGEPADGVIVAVDGRKASDIKVFLFDRKNDTEWSGSITRLDDKSQVFDICGTVQFFHSPSNVAGSLVTIA